jgi:hypothetical protein
MNGGGNLALGWCHEEKAYGQVLNVRTVQVAIAWLWFIWSFGADDFGVSSLLRHLQTKYQYTPRILERNGALSVLSDLM